MSNLNILHIRKLIELADLAHGPDGTAPDPAAQAKLVQTLRSLSADQRLAVRGLVWGACPDARESDAAAIVDLDARLLADRPDLAAHLRKGLELALLGRSAPLTRVQLLRDMLQGCGDELKAITETLGALDFAELLKSDELLEAAREGGLLGATQGLERTLPALALHLDRLAAGLQRRLDGVTAAATSN